MLPTILIKKLMAFFNYALADLQYFSQGKFSAKTLKVLPRPKKRFIFSLLLICSLSSFAQSLLYGPYLQQANPNQMYVCWRTNIPEDSKVKYGLSKFNLNLQSVQSNSVVQHFVLLSALQANTKYFYTIHNSQTKIAPDTFSFITPPNYGSTQKLKFLAMGDCGSGFQEQIKVRDMLNYKLQGQYINAILLLGDNAYDSGLDAEFTTKFFGPYQNNFLFDKSCIYPAPGNHDYAQNGTNHTIAYYDIFKTPQLAEVGGLASNHKEYYSYNYGNVHFIAIDSYGTEPNTTYHVYDTLSDQYTWLKQDLAANTQAWTIVYFHHPPYTMGTHNSDVEWELYTLRQNLIQLFDRFGVDLVLNGHSHNYERSYLLKGHTGDESTFNKVLHCKDTSSAFYNGTPNSCPYVKNGSNAKGTVYAVAGAAGRNGFGQLTFPHDALPFSQIGGSGAMYFEVENNRLQAFYLSADTTIKDRFTIYKNVNKKLALSVSQPTVNLNASWAVGTYNWLGMNQFTKQLTYTVNSNTVLYVRDSLNCLRDTFIINNMIGLSEKELINTFNMQPNPAKNQVNLSWSKLTNVKKLEILSTNGQLLYRQTEFFTSEIAVNTSNWAKGVYIVSVFDVNRVYQRKLIIE
jgi:acid phosphatase type 7